MMRSLTLALISAALLAAPALRASDAQTLNLDQALSEAREHNPELRKLQLAADSADWKRLESAAKYIPHLDLTGTHFLDAKYGNLAVKFGGATIAFPEAF